MAVRIGGKEIAAVYSAAVNAGKDGPAELRRFRQAIIEHSNQEPEFADLQWWPLNRVNEDDIFPAGEF
jgi:hypothetical protein